MHTRINNYLFFSKKNKTCMKNILKSLKSVLVEMSETENSVVSHFEPGHVRDGYVVDGCKIGFQGEGVGPALSFVDDAKVVSGNIKGIVVSKNISLPFDEEQEYRKNLEEVKQRCKVVTVDAAKTEFFVCCEVDGVDKEVPLELNTIVDIKPVLNYVGGLCS